jgi:hypothetical protein
VDFSDRLVNAGYAACAVIAFGAFGPWAKSGPFTQSGLEGIGLATLALAALAAYVLFRWADYPNRDWLIGLGIVAVMCLVASGFFVVNPSTVLDRPEVSASWGLYLSLAGSAALVAVTALLYRR